MEKLERIEKFRQTTGLQYIKLVEKKLEKEKHLKLLGFTNEYFQKFDRCRDY